MRAKSRRATERLFLSSGLSTTRKALARTRAEYLVWRKLRHLYKKSPQAQLIRTKKSRQQTPKPFTRPGKEPPVWVQIILCRLLFAPSWSVERRANSGTPRPAKD